MEKIFELAKTDDKFITRDGRTAIYLCQPNKDVAHRVFVVGDLTYSCYNDYGRAWFEECPHDIVGRLDDNMKIELEDSCKCLSDYLNNVDTYVVVNGQKVDSSEFVNMFRETMKKKQ